MKLYSMIEEQPEEWGEKRDRERAGQMVGGANSWATPGQSRRLAKDSEEKRSRTGQGDGW